MMSPPGQHIHCLSGPRNLVVLCSTFGLMGSDVVRKVPTDTNPHYPVNTEEAEHMYNSLCSFIDVVAQKMLKNLE